MGEETFVIYAAEWIEWLRTTKGRSPKTCHVYRNLIAEFIATMGHTGLDDLTADRIEHYLQRPRHGRAMGNVAQPATQRRDASCIRSFYAYLTARGYVGRNPALLVATPTVHNVQPRPIADDAWVKLWPTVDGTDAIALGLGFFCGLRREELTRLRVSHVDLGGRRLVNFVRKGGGEDVLPVGTMLEVHERRLGHLGGDRLWPLVAAHAQSRTGSDWLLGWSDLGKPTARSRVQLEVGQLDPQHLNGWLDRMTNAAGIGHLTPHRLRHSCATNLLRAGVPLPIASTLLNHSNVQTTMRYLKTGGDALGEWLNGRP